MCNRLCPVWPDLSTRRKTLCTCFHTWSKAGSGTARPGKLLVTCGMARWPTLVYTNYVVRSRRTGPRSIPRSIWETYGYSHAVFEPHAIFHAVSHATFVKRTAIPTQYSTQYPTQFPTQCFGNVRIPTWIPRSIPHSILVAYGNPAWNHTQYPTQYFDSVRKATIESHVVCHTVFW